MSKFDKFVVPPEELLALLDKFDDTKPSEKEERKKLEDKIKSTVALDGGTEYPEKIIACLSDIKWVKENGKVSPRLTLEGLDGEELIAAQICQLVYPRMFISASKKSLTDYPKFSAYTPLGMYAAKLYADIRYDEWDTKDPAIEFFLGRNMDYLYKYKNGYLNTLNAKELRTKFPREGKELIGYSQGLKEKAKLFSRNPDTLGDKYLNIPEQTNHTKLILMVAQYWLANVSLRDTDTMILDPWNWGNIPDALDDTVMEEITTPKTVKVEDDTRFKIRKKELTFPDHAMIPTKDAVFSEKPLNSERDTPVGLVSDTNSPGLALEGLIGEEIKWLENQISIMTKRVKTLKSSIKPAALKKVNRDEDLPF